MTKAIITNNLNETQKVAEDLVEQIYATSEVACGGATVIGLTGDLGSGKTAFTQGFARVLGIKEKITSPTFVLQKNYKICSVKFKTNQNSKIQKFKNLIHIDAYRLDDPKELVNLGWEEIVGNPKNIIIVEWVERIKKILPKKYIQINLEHINEDKRRIRIK